MARADHRRLLCIRRERPGNRCSTKERDELAPHLRTQRQRKRTLTNPDQGRHDSLGPGYYQAPYASSVTTTIVGAPPELIDAAWANASLPLEAAVALRVSIVGKVTSEIR